MKVRGNASDHRELNSQSAAECCLPRLQRFMMELNLLSLFPRINYHGTTTKPLYSVSQRLYTCLIHTLGIVEDVQFTPHIVCMPRRVVRNDLHVVFLVFQPCSKIPLLCHGHAFLASLLHLGDRQSFWSLHDTHPPIRRHASRATSRSSVLRFSRF
ncbi:hypothetical protein BV25DRAFT_932853 [Artomyces pyxidatus]|uniref:Uncharacterized protein n=1 Tax=Artomyces pyxidatus TaxID=48021 RepID=A0ACB8SVL3_9AGAM|nr:hypothetical protein BV25DRAFT_932853 [Artomyces pyxidatus]